MIIIQKQEKVLDDMIKNKYDFVKERKFLLK